MKFQPFLIALAVAAAATSIGQSVPKLTLHNDGKTVKGDNFTTSPHSTTFAFKGALSNVWVKLSSPTAAKVETKYRVIAYDHKGWQERDLKMYIPKGKKEMVWNWMIRPGTYTVKMMPLNGDTPVYQTYAITVTDPKDGAARATGDQTAGQSKVWICRDTDDKWNALDPATYKDGAYHWPANKTFNVMVKNNGKAFGVNFLGFVIHKQGPDGKDTDFVNECQTDQISDKSTMWATVTGLPGMTSLPAGTYTMYVIDWGKRQVNFHSGNLTEYFAKITLVIK